ncbi:MAG: hypothetical protein IT384_08795 [Deltaproteobacteria bacterium]|nr:hypothetical protein [Deltaproteobacteria bacterium]
MPRWLYSALSFVFLALLVAAPMGCSGDGNSATPDAGAGAGPDGGGSDVRPGADAGADAGDSEVPVGADAVAGADGSVLPPNPLHVTPTYDYAGAARSVVGRAGGTVLAFAPNGATLELTVPAGALAAATAITLTPIIGVDQDLGGPVLAGVQIDPPGLRFAGSATLTLTSPVPLAGGPVVLTLGGLPRATPPSIRSGPRRARATLLGEVAVTVSIPVCTGGVLHHVTVPVTSGTSAILIDGTPGTLQIVQGHAPANACLQMGNAFELQRLAQQLADPCGMVDDDLSLVLNDLYFTFVNPVLVAATTDDSQFDTAFERYFCWLSMVQLAGEVETRVLAGNVRGGQSILSDGANHLIDGTRARCAAHDLTAARDLVEILAALLGAFVLPAPNRPNLDVDVLMQAYSECMTFRIDARLDARYDGYPDQEEDHGTLRLRAASRTFYPSVATALDYIDQVGTSSVSVLSHSEIYIAHAGPTGPGGTVTTRITNPANCPADPRLDHTDDVQVFMDWFDAIGLTDPSGPDAYFVFNVDRYECFEELDSDGGSRYLVRHLFAEFHPRAGVNNGRQDLRNWSAAAMPGGPIFATMSFASGLTQTPDGDPGSGDEMWSFDLVHIPR